MTEPRNPSGTPGQHPPPPAPDGNRLPPGQRMKPEAAFAELGRIVLGEQPLGQVLQRVADLAVASIPGAEEVSITLVEDERAKTVAFTGTLAADLDERQYDAGFGPCVDAALTGRTIRINDTGDARDALYPDFAAAARRRGVRSTVSIGMPMPHRVLGGINVYRFNTEPLDEESVHLLQAFASYAAVSLANASLFASTAALAAQLQQAMQSRAVIDQAQGILMAQLHCTPEDAFQHLAKLSQHTNRKLRDLAAEIVERTARGGKA